MKDSLRLFVVLCLGMLIGWLMGYEGGHDVRNLAEMREQYRGIVQHNSEVNQRAAIQLNKLNEKMQTVVDTMDRQPKPDYKEPAQ